MNTVPLVISLVALLLSVISFYFQFFHKKDAVACTLVGSDVKKEKIIAQIVIGNSGTRPIMLRGAHLSLQFKSKPTGFISHNRPNIHEPILIPKGELRSITLTLPIDDELRNHIAGWHKSGAICDSDGSWPIHTVLIFVTVSGKKIYSDENIITVKWREDGHSYSSRDEPWQISSWKFNERLKRLVSDLNS